MASQWNLRLIALSALLIQQCWSLDPSNNVQVDLVFPRNNSNYLPVYPFPIVFAIHNLSSVWKYRPVLAWGLFSIDTYTNTRYQTDNHGIAVAWDENTPDAPPNKLLTINSTDIIIKRDAPVWQLQYALKMGTDECMGNAREFVYHAEMYAQITGSITFNISNTTGIMPDIAAEGPCPLPLGAISFLGENQTDNRCPRLAVPRPAPIPCAFLVDQEVASQVNKSMADSSGCKGKAWPSGTGIGVKCKKRASEGTALSWSTLLTLLPILGLAFSVL